MKLQTIVEIPPVLVVQQRSPSGNRLNFAMVVRSPGPAGKPRLPLFHVKIEEADKDARPIRTSDETVVYAHDFDLTITRDPSGAARMEVAWKGRNGPVTSVVTFDSPGFPAGPVTLYCMGGTFELSELTIE